MNKASKEHAWRHWRTETDLDGVLWLIIDRAGEKTNALGQEVLEELEQIITQVERDRPAGLILMSGKPGNFIVGADIREFDEVQDTETARNYITRAHDLFNRIEDLDCPTATAFEGYCLGGGLELALCTDYIIAKESDTTRIGFPEVKLGIYPGFGGSARTISRIGGHKALPLMLTGRNLRARQARAMGLINQVIGKHQELRWAARRAVLKNRRSAAPGMQVKLVNSAIVRKPLANYIRKSTAKKANPKHYPAPFALIDAWEEHGGDQQALLGAEADNVARLITSETSRNLRRVFNLMETLKAQGKESDFKARRVHVIGAGVMGGDIAAWCVLRGLEVTLQDREMKYIEPALKRAKSLFKRKLKTPERVGAALTRLRADVAGDGVPRADVIIEAIFENLEAKKALYADIEPRMRDDAILATNTSALPLADLAADLQRPARLVGIHYFNPVAKMPLVEVVYDPDLTDSAEVDRAASFVAQIGKFPLPAKSSPGFLVNRVLGAYMMKALELNQQGHSKEALDKAAERFGMPMGPVELADTVGLDVGLSVINTLRGDDAADLVKQLQEKVDAGHKGKKTGQGFYRWEKGKAQKDADAADGADLDALAKMLMKPYLDECQAALDEGIVASADLLDAGMIFGTGFAPFRGGPLHYLSHTQTK
ncbi:MAG: 3-hydroxyacyl-CoA dehydrogenase NAD-binding domain-containing protein [Wenzhouxiangellaceae bacterium]